jgi:hypothetical protein
MPPQRHQTRSKGSKNLAEAQKGAIVTLHKFSGLGYPYIAGEIQVGASTAHRVYHDAEKACAERSLSPTLPNLLSTIISAQYSGRPPKVRNGSTLSADIRAAIIEFGTYDIEDFILHVLRRAGIEVSRNALIRIAHDHRDSVHNYAIVSGVRPLKLELDDEARSLREEYVAWILSTCSQFSVRIIFVCYDETNKAIGGRNNRGGKLRVWKRKGGDANKYAAPYRPPSFNLMICAATSTDSSLRSTKRPCLVWVAEDEENREQTLERVQAANKKARGLIDNKRARAEVPGTQEERALRELNQNILHRNEAAKAANRAAGKKGAALCTGCKNLLTVNKFFKYEDFQYKSGKGMNGIWYAERVLKDILFPYYTAVRDNNPGAQVYLVQDNVSLHGLGLR